LEINEALIKINSFKKQFLNYVYFQLNLLELDNLLKSLSNIPVTNINVNNIGDYNTYLNINRIVFNLLSSFKFYLDSTETYLKRKFGKASIESIQFIKETNVFFDNSFAYRFLSKLRHYSQHIGLPIHIIPFQATENLTQPHKMRGDFQLIVSREILLSEKELLGGIVYKEIQSFNDDINIKPFVYDLATIVGKLESLVYEFHTPELENAIQLLTDDYGYLKTKTNKVVIMYDVTIGEQYHTFKTISIPFEVVFEINNFRNWMKVNCN
jgi:hypothetical protein